MQLFCERFLCLLSNRHNEKQFNWASNNPKNPPMELYLNGVCCNDEEIPEFEDEIDGHLSCSILEDSIIRGTASVQFESFEDDSEGPAVNNIGFDRKAAVLYNVDNSNFRTTIMTRGLETHDDIITGNSSRLPDGHALLHGVKVRSDLPL